eukprot:TRINITY_DN49086_c0_g1_i1.p1 TRINITY_DN49086_c0_g1~~TRINITY_DN49086_c0_g1_i1.p1  ORF type:complete len:455 (+),score=78.40 TRINITY_DN49086_c0_g1_i1:65-1429(+)
MFGMFHVFGVRLIWLAWIALLHVSLQASATEDREKAEPMGHGLLKHWVLNRSYTNLNHGSYGSPPRQVLEAEHRWQLQMEMNPDLWFRYSGPDALSGALESVRARLSNYIGSSSQNDVVFVDGASGGVNAILRSLRLPAASRLLLLNTAYRMVKNTAKYIQEHDKLEKTVEVSVQIPSSDDAIVKLVSDALENDPAIKLASFSHITSVPAVILPVKRLAKVCHEKGVMVLIDGAHALGHIPVNVSDIGADFYIANGHKWLYSPKGSGIIWVTPELQHLVHPNVISYEGQGKTQFQMQFEYTGTKDYSAFLAMGAALDFREKILGGDMQIMSYMHSLASSGGQRLAEMWHTEKLVEDDFIGAMVNVRLPLAADPCCSKSHLSSHLVSDRLSNTLLDRFGTWVPVFGWNNHCFARVSAQVYNELSDFEMFGNAVLALLKDGICKFESDKVVDTTVV